MKNFIAMFSIFLTVLILAVFIRAALGEPNVYLPEVFSTFETFRYAQNIDFSTPATITTSLFSAAGSVGEFAMRFVNSLFGFNFGA